MKSESNKIQGQRVFNTTQRQIVNLIVIVVILGVIGEFFYYDSEYSRMQQLVNSEKTEHDSILQRIINFKSSSLNAYTNDYTYWDEMVLFAQNGDTAWAHANIDASLSTYGADYVWVFDSASVLKYFTRATDSGLIDSNMLNVNMLMESSADKRFNHFYAEDIGKIIEISVYTIHPTSDPHRVSEPKGYYAAGKWLSPQYMLGISELTGTGLRFLSEAQEYIDEDKRNDFQVTNFYNLYGSNGNILTQIVSFKEFTNLKSAFAQFRTQLMLTNFVIAVILLGGAFILFQLVNKPLSQINRALAAGETKYIQPLINKENEFGHLAGMINDFFEQKQQLLSEINERIDTEQKMKITESRLKDSLLEKEVLIKEVHHRVKNNLQIIISLIRLQANKVTDQNLHSYLNETLNRIKSIALVHEMLYRSDDLSHIEFKEYLMKITESLKTIYADETRNLNINVSSDNVYFTVDKAVPCAIIINELVTNSIKHAFKKNNTGKINISLNRQNGFYNMIISDDGCGLKKDFNFHKSESLGMTLVDSLTDQLDAEICVDNTQGTTFNFHFPVN